LKDANGGTVTLKVTETPVSTRYLRVLMTESSHTCDEHATDDVRNCVGYAIQQITAGTIDAHGAFIEVPKDPKARRTTYCVSSIDPWHSADDVNDSGAYQHVGFDLFFTSGLTNKLPAMVPVTLLYGTPEDAAAQIAYIEKRGYPLGYVEVGEEPDGKHAMPEDYATLYIQWARRRRLGLLPLPHSARGHSQYLPRLGVMVELRLRRKLRHQGIYITLLRRSPD
jgi:hypothetical protein